MGGPKKAQDTVLVESDSSKPPQEGLMVARLLANVTKGCVPVRILNLSEKDVVVNPKTLLGDAFLIKNVIFFSKSSADY